MEEYKFQLKPLPGHTTEDTAYVVDDYPYGFRLRCKIRYWLEYRSSQGFRLCSQTTNPKLSYEFWNKPKKSTYFPLGFMGLNTDNHVDWDAVHPYYPEKLAAFVSAYGDSFDKNQKLVAKAMKMVCDHYLESEGDAFRVVRSRLLVGEIVGIKKIDKPNLKCDNEL